MAGSPLSLPLCESSPTAFRPVRRGDIIFPSPNLIPEELGVGKEIAGPRKTHAGTLMIRNI